MKNNNLDTIQKNSSPSQGANSRMGLISKIAEIICLIANGERISIKNHQGYWFRHHKDLAMPIGSRLRWKGNGIRTWNSLANNKFFEMRAKWWFRHYEVKEGDFIIDIGAGMGEDTYVFSKAVGSHGSVLAIEAHPATFKSLSLFIKLNNIQNVEAENLVISNDHGTLWLSSLPDDDWQCNSVICNKESENKLEVKTIRIDDLPYLKDKNVINFLKINIEGAEILALDGARLTLQKTKNICVCCHDFLGISTQTKNDVCAILVESGFTLSFTNPDSPPYERDFVYGTKRPSEGE